MRGSFRQPPFTRNAKSYENYYSTQVGHGLPVFVGGRSIHGRGLGNLLGGIGRTLIPLLKSGGKALLKEGARAGMGVAQDVLSGQNVKSALRQRAQQAGKHLLHRAIEPSPSGQPATKKRKHIKRPSNQRQRQRTPRRQRDIFG